MNLNSIRIKQLAKEYGFDIAGICDVRTQWQYGDKLREFLDNGYHGTMEWLETTFERRSHPNKMWDNAISAVMLGVNYAPDYAPLNKLNDANIANISSYSQNNDYHEVIKKRLKALAGFIHSELGCEVKVFVDTAPLMEKPLAERAGLGWQGKHTNLVSREFGSYLLLGSILIAQELEFDAPEINHCGSCQSCIDICPTGAIIAPYKLDARKCISYLTIEHNGAIDDELMAKMGNHIYGCDDCIAICPWNKFAIPTDDVNFLPRDIVSDAILIDFLSLDDANFRIVFSKSPIKRIGINKFLRNVIIAIGNSKNKKYINNIKPFSDNDDIGIKAATNWAIANLEKL